MPTTAPFKLNTSPRKGCGVFATRNISRGELILRETPLFIIRKPNWQMNEQDISKAVQRLPTGQKAQFSSLRINGETPFKSFGQAFAGNSFLITSPDGYDGNRGSWAHGCFILLSRFNHSCVPNAKVPTSGGSGETLECRAVRDIAAGEEIMTCYNPNFEGKTREERQEETLYAAHMFSCKCEACTLGTAFQRANDLRRRLVRGLRYLSFGKDTDGSRQDGIVPDARLRRAAERFDVPLSSRFVYSLMLGGLLEAEGLLDDFMLEEIEAGTSVADFMATPSNAAVAMQAMAQEGWGGKLSVAFNIFGKEDASDREFAEGSRRAKGIR